MLILSLIEHRARHGYEISKLIEERSEGVLKFNVASFYPLLYRLEKRGLIAGRWVEKAGQRRRRYYRLTTEGKQILKTQQATWLEFRQRNPSHYGGGKCLTGQRKSELRLLR